MNALKLRRGTSLVEVLVAMVILLLGIFSLVQLFPSGFTTILYGRDVTQAQALTNGLVQAARVNAASLPDMVEAVDPVTRLPNPALPVTEELTQFPPSQPNQPVQPDTRFSDINKVRRVVGETTRIPAPTITSPYAPPGTPISIYFLQFGPIYSAVSTKSGLGGITVYAGNPLNRVVLDGPANDQQLAALDPYSYGIDYQNAVLYFAPVTVPRLFKLDYSFTVPVAPTAFVNEQSPPGTTIVIPANANSFDLRQAHGNQPAPFFPLPAGARLDTGQEFLYPAFDQLAPNQPFSATDPYQYKVLNPVIGILGFNPVGATPGAGGSSASGITAKIDYDVDDWHIIHEDRQVPLSTPHQVKLTLDGIAQVGDIDEYQEPYTALMKDFSPERPSPTPGTDVLVVDLETGLTMDNHTLAALGGGANQVRVYNGDIDYHLGAIRFNDQVVWTLPNGSPTGALPIAGKRIRIYYRTPQDWGLQFTKAATEYVKAPNVNNLGYGEYVEGSLGYLYFPVQDHDAGVLVDYTWVQHEQGQDVTRTETGEYHQILDPTLAISPQTLHGARTNDWWVQVDGVQRGDYVPNSVHILRVRGVTVRARAIWRAGNRWRTQDLDSYVGRDQGT